MLVNCQPWQSFASSAAPRSGWGQPLPHSGHPVGPLKFFCVQCGNPYERAFRFCNHCGSQLPPHSPAVTEVPVVSEHQSQRAAVNVIESVRMGQTTTSTHENRAETLRSEPPSEHAVRHAPEIVPIQGASGRAGGQPAATSSTTVPDDTRVASPDSDTAADIADTGTVLAPVLDPPVVRFVLLALGAMFALSVIAFAVADDLGRGAVAVWIPLLIAVFALPFLLFNAGKTRGTLRRIGATDEAVDQAGRHLVKHSVVFAVLFTIIASTVGYLTWGQWQRNAAYAHRLGQVR